VPYVLLSAAAAILAGVVVVAMGRGGELAMFPRDRPVSPPPTVPPPPGPGWDAAADREADGGWGPGTADGEAE
jgi:hypothetical protein